jgi:hypothetical protein
MFTNRTGQTYAHRCGRVLQFEMLSFEKILSTRLFSLRSLIQLSTAAEIDLLLAGSIGFCNDMVRFFLTTRIGRALEFFIYCDVWLWN